jgi:hypothetical protein
MKRLSLLLAVFALAGCGSDPEPRPVPPKELPLEQKPVRERDMETAIADGTAYLLREQRPGGYWGTGCRPLGWDIYANPPGSHRAFKLGTTALCTMALRRVGTPEALAAAARGEDWMAAEGGEARRSTPDEIYCIWGNVYGLQALSVAIMAEGADAARKEKLIAGAREQLDLLVRYESAWGGWNYYDFAAFTRTPSLEPTSFTTAAALIALKEAKAAGIEVPERLIKRGVRILEKCRSPLNTFLYSYDWRYYPRGDINRPGGSLGRTQACNDALFESGAVKLATTEKMVGGLERLFKEYWWLECGRKRPYPHEAYLAVAGYFYYFGHYYGSRMLAHIPKEDSRKFAQHFSDTIRPKQEEDGSWWDFGMWDYHKPYGTAYALMILRNAQDALKGP